MRQSTGTGKSKAMAGRTEKRAVLIAGPTASGKSALALARARETGGIIVNADAMQVYDGLAIVTARPSAEEMEQAEHHLYGTVPPNSRFTTGDWAAEVRKIIRRHPDRVLIFAGGTGLYFEALTNGFTEVPRIPEAAVAEAEAEIAGLDRAARGRLLADRDPAMAARLKAPDPQRVVRALSVLKATGRSLASFQDEEQHSLIEGFDVERIVLNPDRAVLRRRIADRFAHGRVLAMGGGGYDRRNLARAWTRVVEALASPIE
jgi:tRNA dimethylallyltransferase